MVLMVAVSVLVASGMSWATVIDPVDLVGFRSTFEGEGMTGAGAWGDGGMIFSWEIAQDVDTGLWSYEYNFEGDDQLPLSPDVSHWILELSSTITTENLEELILDPNFEFLRDAEGNLEDPQTYSPGHPSNDGLPNPIYGIKIETEFSASLVTFTFMSPRAPMWGDLFVKDGAQAPYAYNNGLADPTSMSKIDFIAVPDTTNGNGRVPEPGIVFLLGSGLVALGLRRRRQR
jgi:hypothetical protein